MSVILVTQSRIVHSVALAWSELKKEKDFENSLMLSFLRKSLSSEKLHQIKAQAISAFEAGNYDEGFEILNPIIKVQDKQQDAALRLIEIVEDYHLTIEDSLDLLEQIYNSHLNNIEIVSAIGGALEAARNIDELNLEPPESPLFESVVCNLSSALKENRSEDQEAILTGLSTATRLMARQHDSISEDSYRRLVEMSPNEPSSHYSLGLFCKTRGLFEEGMLANQKGLELLDEPLESYLWNFGICATGAGHGELALEVWKGMGNKLEMGRFNLPEGGYPSCKVKLAEFPLSERTKSNDSPGQEETIWIERLSPCHGIIRSVLYQDLGVKYGDVVLIDGAPITYHKYDDTEIPVFPHLATLQRSNYQHYDFAAIQESDGQIHDLSLSLNGDSVVYSHTENFRVLCNSCWLDPNNDHEDHENEEKRVVKGKVAASNESSAKELLSQIDAAMSELLNCQLYSPQLCEAAGFSDRAAVEQKRFDMLIDNTN